MIEQEFATPGEAVIAHHGVKGMRWGIRDEDAPAGASPTRNWSSIVAAHPKPKPQEAAAAHVKAERNFKNRINPSDKAQKPTANEPRHKMDPATKKKLLIGAAATAVVIGGAYAVHQNPKLIAQIKSQAGKPLSKEEFIRNMEASKKAVWNGSPGYIDNKVLARAEFSLPPGHTFHQLSTAADGGKAKGVQHAVMNMQDLGREATAFRSDSDVPLHLVGFKSKAPVRVPALHTVLETLGEEMRKEAGPAARPISRDQALRRYHEINQTGWGNGHRNEDQLLKALKKKGYGALVNDMEAGVTSESPLVVFAGKFTSKNSTPLSENAIRSAADNLTEISNRKF